LGGGGTAGGDVYEPRQVSVGVRPGDQVDQAVALQQAVLEALGHAAQHADDGRR
jgi:hypothetical protein